MGGVGAAEAGAARMESVVSIAVLRILMRAALSKCVGPRIAKSSTRLPEVVNLCAELDERELDEAPNPIG